MSRAPLISHHLVQNGVMKVLQVTQYCSLSCVTPVCHDTRKLQDKKSCSCHEGDRPVNPCAQSLRTWQMTQVACMKGQPVTLQVLCVMSHMRDRVTCTVFMTQFSTQCMLASEIRSFTPWKMVCCLLYKQHAEVQRPLGCVLWGIFCYTSNKTSTHGAMV
jgi:hypothetical protein